jgi:glutathione S-transferase
MSYRLHCFAQSGNAYKAALMLTLTGQDWEPVFVDFFHGATRTPEFRAEVNELGEVPVLETRDRRLTQSGAILTWLSETTGRFGPRSDDERYEVLRWILFDNHKFTSYLATYRFLRSLAPRPADPAVMTFLKGRFDASLAILEGHLAKSPFVVGDEPTIADLSLCGYLFYPSEETGYDWPQSHPAVAAWLDRIRALPGWQHPYHLMPGHPLLKAAS